MSEWTPKTKFNWGNIPSWTNKSIIDDIKKAKMGIVPLDKDNCGRNQFDKLSNLSEESIHSIIDICEYIVFFPEVEHSISTYYQYVQDVCNEFLTEFYS